MACITRSSSKSLLVHKPAPALAPVSIKSRPEPDFGQTSRSSGQPCALARAKQLEPRVDLSISAGPFVKLP